MHVFIHTRIYTYMKISGKLCATIMPLRKERWESVQKSATCD